MEFNLKAFSSLILIRISIKLQLIGWFHLLQCRQINIFEP